MWFENGNYTIVSRDNSMYRCFLIDEDSERIRKNSQTCKRVANKPVCSTTTTQTISTTTSIIYSTTTVPTTASSIFTTTVSTTATASSIDTTTVLTTASPPKKDDSVKTLFIRLLGGAIPVLIWMVGRWCWTANSATIFRWFGREIKNEVKGELKNKVKSEVSKQLKKRIGSKESKSSPNSELSESLKTLTFSESSEDENKPLILPVVKSTFK